MVVNFYLDVYTTVVPNVTVLVPGIVSRHTAPHTVKKAGSIEICIRVWNGMNNGGTSGKIPINVIPFHKNEEEVRKDRVVV